MDNRPTKETPGHVPPPEMILHPSMDMPAWATRQTAQVPPNTHRITECPVS